MQKKKLQQQKQTKWIPEIFYEEQGEGLSGHIPFIAVPKTEEMPKIIFIFESRETGEFEPGMRGEELPVTEITLHQYADMDSLKIKLTTEEYDRVREALGLQPMKIAVEAGKTITQNVQHQLLSTQRMN
jgi:hypothetical protein